MIKNKVSATDLTDREDNTDIDRLQRTVFSVLNMRVPERLSPPPTFRGQECLSRLVYEAKKYYRENIKKVETEPLTNVSQQILDFSEKHCNKEFDMDKEDQLKIVDEFSKLRLKLEAKQSKIGYNQLKQITDAVPKMCNEDEWLEIILKKENFIVEDLVVPKRTLCLALPQSAIFDLLDNIEQWLDEEEISVPDACQWVYILMACLELPLCSDVCATLRQIVRTLIDRRSQLEKIDSEELPHIGVVICIVGRYFGQLDLVDPMV